MNGQANINIGVYNLPQTGDSPMPPAERVSPPMVEVRGLKKSYGLKPTLRGIDLTLARGERLALLGANGAGKTTLLRILAGLTRPSQGSVRIGNLDIASDGLQARRMVGFVAHQPYLYEELTALENLRFFARMYTVEHGEQRAKELLERVGLMRRAQERVGTFSRGQVQRLAWARAMLHTPPLLLLDEPDTGLDQEGHELIDGLLAEHAERGGSAIFTTHQLERALQLSNKIVILGKGRVTYQHDSASLTVAALQQIYNEMAR